MKVYGLMVYDIINDHYEFWDRIFKTYELALEYVNIFELEEHEYIIRELDVIESND